MDFLKPSLTLLRARNAAPETNLKLLLSRTLEKEPESLRANVSRLVYGVTRKEKLLDYLLEKLSGRKTASIEASVLEILRAGLYLLLFSASAPPYAVVNEAASVAPRRATGFVNAILRKCSRELEPTKRLAESVTDPLIRFSVASTLFTEIQRLPGPPEPYLEYLDREPVFHLLSPPGLMTPDQVETLPHAHQVPFQPLAGLPCLEISTHAGAVRKLIKKGAPLYFQNTASQVICGVAASLTDLVLQTPPRFLDPCCAPGTKTLTMALLRPRLEITAADIHAGRLKMASELLRQYFPHRIRLTVADAARPAFTPSFDVILLDAPCSSAGTIRKNPDLKQKITPALIRRNAVLQREILLQTIQAYAPPPESNRTVFLVYSVCTFTLEETETITNDLCEFFRDNTRIAHPIRVEPVDLLPFLTVPALQIHRTGTGYLLLPSETLNNDIFYIAAFKVTRPAGS